MTISSLLILIHSLEVLGGAESKRDLAEKLVLVIIRVPHAHCQIEGIHVVELG